MQTQFSINISGQGKHHLGNRSDAEHLAQGFLGALKAAGHKIDQALFTVDSVHEDLNLPTSVPITETGEPAWPTASPSALSGPDPLKQPLTAATESAPVDPGAASQSSPHATQIIERCAVTIGSASFKRKPAAIKTVASAGYCPCSATGLRAGPLADNDPALDFPSTSWQSSGAAPEAVTGIPATPPAPTEIVIHRAEIAERAREIAEAKRAKGETVNDDADWFEAEAQLRAERTAAASAAPGA